MTTYASTFLDAQNAVIDSLRLDAIADLQRTKDWLNRTLLDIAVQSKFFSGSAAGSALTAAASNQALPATLVELEYATVAYGGQTQLMQPIYYDKLLILRSASGTVASGPPQLYCLRASTLEFWPNAAGGEVIEYYGTTLPPAMVNNTDVSGLPEPFATRLLISGACIPAADFKNDPRIYTFYQSDYAAWMAQFLGYLNARVTDSSRGWPVYGPDGRPFNAGPFLPHDPSSDFYVTGLRG